MQINFFKYQGTGNDFIMLDNRKGEVKLNREQIAHLCDRKFGIGSDGIVMIEESDHSDFYMNFFNPDGSRSFCGNGSRCAVRFAQRLGLVNNKGEFKAIDTAHDFESDDQEVRIKMKNVLGVETNGEHYIIQTGSPHYIIYVPDIETVDLVKQAHTVRYSERFRKEGINVNLVTEKEGALHVRTYERGVEAETLSCGTGVTAVALSYAMKNPALNQVKVITRGGILRVNFSNLGNGEFENVWLCGPAYFVFEGKMNI